MFGKSILEMCKQLNIYLVNGRTEGKSVIDYMIMSTPLFHRIIDFKVINIVFTQHFPIVTKLDVAFDNCKQQVAQYCKYKWRDSEREGFFQLKMLTLYSKYFSKKTTSFKKDQWFSSKHLCGYLAFMKWIYLFNKGLVSGCSRHTVCLCIVSRFCLCLN